MNLRVASFVMISLVLFNSGCEEDNTLDGELPSISTTNVMNISGTSAISGGNITDDGGLTITDRGICWSINQSPTLDDTHSNEGTGTGSFTSNLAGLDINTMYYVRSYATNSKGTEYGNEISFTTLDGLPGGLTTKSISDITLSSANSGGVIIDDGDFAITARGVCWSTSQNPTIDDAYTTDGTGTGSFTSNITGLSEWTTYYVRAYATNVKGTSYGDEQSFVAYNTSKYVMDYDGNIYGIITVGDQVWMAENLKTTHYADGTEINIVESQESWYNLQSDDNMCYYDNSTANKDIYGALYNWKAAMKGAESSSLNPSGVQGVCPDGWHIPSDAEWKELEIHLGMNPREADNSGLRGTNEGSKLAGNAGLWTQGNLNSNAEFGTSGFDILPSGGRTLDGRFFSLEEHADLWSATEYDPSRAWYRNLYFDKSEVRRDYYWKGYGFSVRCVKDKI